MAVAEGRTRAELEEPALVRCSECLGLRTVSHRNRGSVARCPDCRRGETVPRGILRLVARALQRGGVRGDGSRNLGLNVAAGAQTAHPYLPPWAEKNP